MNKRVLSKECKIGVCMVTGVEMEMECSNGLWWNDADDAADVLHLQKLVISLLCYDGNCHRSGDRPFVWTDIVVMFVGTYTLPLMMNI